jgi:ankyrin repeat protein
MLLKLVISLASCQMQTIFVDCSESAMLAYVIARSDDDLRQCIKSGRAGNLSAGGNQLLNTAIRFNLFDEVKILLEEGADPNVRSEESSRTVPLHLAMARIPMDAVMVKELLKWNADPNIPDHRGGTPLHWAAQIGSLESIKLLIESGAKTDALDDRGWSAIDYGRVRVDEEPEGPIMTFLRTNIIVSK